MRLKGVTEKDLAGTKSFGNQQFKAYDSSKKQLGSHKTLEVEKMTSIQSKSKEINE